MKKHLAREDARVLACIGSRGIAPQAVCYVADLFDLSEIRIHSPNSKSRDSAVNVLGDKLGPVHTNFDVAVATEKLS